MAEGNVKGISVFLIEARLANRRKKGFRGIRGVKGAAGEGDTGKLMFRHIHTPKQQRPNFSEDRSIPLLIIRIVSGCQEAYPLRVHYEEERRS